MSHAMNLIRLARPQQWAKGVFVLVGPLYGLQELPGAWWRVLGPAGAAFVAFGLASSASYIVNDILDAENDRRHPRKKNRPVASGAVTPARAWALSAVLFAAAAAMLLAVPGDRRLWVGAMVAAYVLNVGAYSAYLKHVIIADVVCLAMGFVLRVLGGCAAVGIGPTTWLLNCTLFLAMFLAFGKRLGERRTMDAAGGDAAGVRGVQAAYTDELLRMAVVVTGVAALITYAGYVQARESGHMAAFAGGELNLLWLTMVPASYGLLRCIVLLEQGRYDDPTELAARDAPMRLSALAFAAVTGAVLVMSRYG